VIPGDMNGLVVFPDNRLVLFSVLREFCLSWPVGLSVPALIGRSPFGGKDPVLDYQTVLKSEEVEEDALTKYQPSSWLKT
jgi:hypothetical protein